MLHFFLHTIYLLQVSPSTTDAFSTVGMPLITALLGGAIGYFFGQKLLKLERNADFQKKLDEEQLQSHKKLYAAAKNVSLRKENPFSMAYRQKDGKVFLRRIFAKQFVDNISTFLSSEDGAFIDVSLSHPLWGLRNLVYAILDFEKASTNEEIELTKKGDDIVNYVDSFHNNFRQLYNLRNRTMINIEPK